MTISHTHILIAQACSQLPESLRQNEGIRQAIASIKERYPEWLRISAQDIQELSQASKTLANIFNNNSVNITLQFAALCEVSSELFKAVKDIRKEIKGIISDNEQALLDDNVGSLAYVPEFRRCMGPALARSIVLRNFANMVDAVLLAQIQYSDENVEIELLIEAA
jgi:type I site-specific restriction endonuclease